MFAVAQRLAAKSTHPFFRHAAIVERGGAVVAMGYNHEGRHAEVVALSKIWPNRRQGLRLWSLRFTKAGKLGMAKPCLKCQAFLRENGVRVVWYSTSKGTIEKMHL